MLPALFLCAARSGCPLPAKRKRLSPAGSSYTGQASVQADAREFKLFWRPSLERTVPMYVHYYHTVLRIVNVMLCTHTAFMDDEPENRTERFLGRCTPEQKRLWEKAARIAKRSLSDWLRIVADEAAEQLIQEKDKKTKGK